MTVELIKTYEADGTWFKIMVDGDNKKSFLVNTDENIKKIEASVYFDRLVKSLKETPVTEVLKTVTL